MRLVFLIIGSVFSVLFIVLLLKGSKYDSMFEVLDVEDYPLRSIYGVGLSLQEMKLFKLKGKIGDDLRNTASLYYSRQYSEFYARIIWAQVLSFSLMCLSLFFVLAGLIDSMSLFFAGLAVICALLAGYYFLTYIKSKVNTRQDECEGEFPNAISKLALIVNSGVILHNAWETVAYGNDGVFYDLMKRSCDEMKNGKSDIDALYEFGVLTNSDDIKKFTSALIQSIERGGGDISQFLINQSSELWARRRQYMLQKGEKAASALLMPIALMFAGVMLIVIAAAVQSFSL